MEAHNVLTLGGHAEDDGRWISMFDRALILVTDAAHWHGERARARFFLLFFFLFLPFFFFYVCGNLFAPLIGTYMQGASNPR